jgi:polysaccharide deacetylase family protein (PEP-CTERM system associated)
MSFKKVTRTQGRKSQVINALSFDVEEYFQVSNFESVIKREDWDNLESRLYIGLNKILDILDEKDVKATFFVLGWVAERHPNLIKHISEREHEISTHGYEHKLIYKQKKAEFEEDLVKSIKTIEGITGNKILGFRAPSFSITKSSLWALEILAKNNIKYDASIFPILHHRYGIENSERFPYHISNNGYNIIEYPCSTIRILGRNIPFSGGGYLRLLPYKVIKNFIKWINKEYQPVIIYLHPWELDINLPRIKAGAMNEFRHYYNLDSTEVKLRHLLDDFCFTTVKEALGI